MIVAVTFIGGGNRSTSRKPPPCRMSLTNFITKCCIEYTSPLAGFNLTTLVVIHHNPNPQLLYGGSLMNIIKFSHTLLLSGLKKYSNWPTYPQLYGNGELYSIQHYVIKVSQWLATGQWFSPESSTNKTDCHKITEKLL
jgi:glutaredoxin-related protein